MKIKRGVILIKRQRNRKNGTKKQNWTKRNAKVEKGSSYKSSCCWRSDHGNNFLKTLEHQKQPLKRVI